jgi:thymidylate kinase
MMGTDDRIDTARAALLEPQAAPRPAATGARVFGEALTCLGDAHVQFALLRDDPRALDRLADLDLLVEPRDRRLAFAALERAGFALRRDRRLRAKWVFVRFEAGRFFAIDLHEACVQGGIVYMDARLALGRLDRGGPAPRLGPEDRFVHLLLHNLLGKPALQDKHLPALRALAAARLDAARLEAQTRPFGTGEVVRRALQDLEALAHDPPAWRRLRLRLRARLLLHPANLAGACRHRWGDRLRLRRRPVVLALLGPDGSGKTTFADTLEAVLRDSPLRAGRVYMGCWGHDHLPMRQARRLVPPQVSYVRLLLHRCGLELVLNAGEREVLEARPSWRALLGAALRTGLKGLAFHAALAAEMTYRYLRFVAAARRPIVIADRWVHDLEFRQGRVPFAHGGFGRRFLYRLFPKPDGVLYLSAPYELVARRKAQLDRRQYEDMDRIFRQVLQPLRPLHLVTDRPAAELAHDFLAHHWEDVLRRCNQRA